MSTKDLGDRFLETSGGRSLAWLADAPMFIDAEQVTALYNAVAKPEHETEKITLSLKDTKKFELEGKASAEVEVGLADWLKTVFPFLDAKAKIGAEGSATHGSEKENGSEIELRPIDTPQRQLVQLALHYLINLPHRTKLVKSFDNPDWLGADFISTLPRGLVFVDFPAGTKFVPMAAEVEGGTVYTIYPDLVKSFVGPNQTCPECPEPAYYRNKADKAEEFTLKCNNYWKFFQDHFSSRLAMEAVELSVSKGGKLIRWIDYQVPLGNNLPCLHFNISARGHYDTGTFAYRLVRRGFKHGLRVVGTMKSEPGMNVLAIFER